MIKSLELAGPSCLTNAADDEPLFVLRANDELAAGIVRAWAFAYHDKHASKGTMTKERFAKFTEALQLAMEMDEWQRRKQHAAGMAAAKKAVEEFVAEKW